MKFTFSRLQNNSLLTNFLWCTFGASAVIAIQFLLQESQQTTIGRASEVEMVAVDAPPEAFGSHGEINLLLGMRSKDVMTSNSVTLRGEASRGKPMSLLLANQTDYIGVDIDISEWADLDGTIVNVSGQLYRYFNDPDEITVRQERTNRMIAIQPGWVYLLRKAKLESIDAEQE